MTLIFTITGLIIKIITNKQQKHTTPQAKEITIISTKTNPTEKELNEIAYLQEMLNSASNSTKINKVICSLNQSTQKFKHNSSMRTDLI